MADRCSGLILFRRAAKANFESTTAAAFLLFGLLLAMPQRIILIGVQIKAALQDARRLR
jgi:hypothetical protein